MATRPSRKQNRDGDEAIKEAKSLKDSGTLIYAVGTFQTDDVNDLTPYSNRYMQAVSSDYPNAAGATLSELGERAPDSDYYMRTRRAPRSANSESARRTPTTT